MAQQRLAEVKPLVIIGGDPGKQTGLVLWTGHTLTMQKSLLAAEVNAEVNLWLEQLVKVSHGFEIVVAVERYTIGTGTTRKTRQTDALKVTGQLEALAATYGATFRLVNQSDSKKLASDHRLKAIGWWVKGPDHINDAARVALTTLAQLRPTEFAELIGL